MRFSRTELLVGEDGFEKLRAASVAVFGLGGVGSYALEALARAGIGHLLLVDFDTVDVTNVNRQLLALDNTVGRAKVDVARERVQLINPDAHVQAVKTFISPANVHGFLTGGLGHAIDAIDALTPKVHLLLALHESTITFVSCMGAAAKLMPSAVRVADISETRYCPLARRIRQSLRRYGVFRGVRCVYSEEPPRDLRESEFITEAAEEESEHPIENGKRRNVLGSISYVPGIIGLTAAGIIINDILSPSPAA